MHDCASILDGIAKGISLLPRFFAWCIPTSIFMIFFALVIIRIELESLCSTGEADSSLFYAYITYPQIASCSCSGGFQERRNGNEANPQIC